MAKTAPVVVAERPISMEAASKFYARAAEIVTAIKDYLVARHNATGRDVVHSAIANTNTALTGEFTTDPATGKKTYATVPLEKAIASLADTLVDWGIAADAYEAVDFVRLAGQARPDMLRVISKLEPGTPDFPRPRWKYGCMLVGSARPRPATAPKLVLERPTSS